MKRKIDRIRKFLTDIRLRYWTIRDRRKQRLEDKHNKRWIKLGSLPRK